MILDPTWLKEYVSHETLAAFCSLELIGLLWVTRALLREKDRRLEDMRTLAPLTDKLLRIVSATSAKRKSQASATSPSPSPILK